MEYLALTTECGTIRVSMSSGISFSSNPPGADIYVIGSGSGIPPVYTGFQTPKILLFPEGNYEYILKLTGFDDYTNTTLVNHNTITYVTADLIPKSMSILPALASIGAISMLVAITRSTVSITTGILGGKAVTVKL